MMPLDATRIGPSRKRQQRGFTLLEFMVSIGFMAALAGLISGSTFLSMKTTRETGAVADVAVQTARTARWLVRDVHRAESTSIVDLAAPVSSASFSWNDGGPVTCTLSLNGSSFDRDCGGTTAQIGRYISNLEFSRTGSLITVNYQITPPSAPDRVETVDLKIAMGGG